MTTKERLISLAEHNIWSNERLFSALEAMPKELITKDVGVYFKSILGTINHNVLVQKLYLQRIAGECVTITDVNTYLADTLEGLKSISQADEQRVLEICKSLDRGQKTITFITITDKKEYTYELETILFHLFNHQTQHKGQLTALIEQSGYNFAPIDYLMFLGSKK